MEVADTSAWEPIFDQCMIILIMYFFIKKGYQQIREFLEKRGIGFETESSL